ncbi:MAG TPA: PDZ domain-containing protein [Gemmatimonadaceae bacterium]
MRRPASLATSQEVLDSILSDSFHGTIGAGILRQTRVTFDYAHGKVHLARIAPAVAGDSVDASGLIFEHRDSASGRWFVQELVPDSPAEAAGLRIGDELIELDGQPVSSLGDVRERLRQSGTTCVLVVRRGQETIQVVLQLRALV